MRGYKLFGLILVIGFLVLTIFQVGYSRGQKNVLLQFDKWYSVMGQNVEYQLTESRAGDPWLRKAGEPAPAAVVPGQPPLVKGRKYSSQEAAGIAQGAADQEAKKIMEGLDTPPKPGEAEGVLQYEFTRGNSVQTITEDEITAAVGWKPVKPADLPEHLPPIADKYDRKGGWRWEVNDQGEYRFHRLTPKDIKDGNIKPIQIRFLDDHGKEVVIEPTGKEPKP